MYFFKITFFIFSNYFVTTLFAFVDDKTLKELGKKELHRIKSKSITPFHGICWHDALKVIQSSCDKLNDNEHTLLALNLANCFLKDSGHTAYTCHLKNDETERRKCIFDMSDRAFSVYNEFYIHASHMCFFLNHEIWQAETQSTIKNLYEASSLMKQQLSDASKIQGVMLESQKEGLKIQTKLLDNGKELENIIQSSTASVVNMVTNFKESVRDQKELLFQIFAYLKTFQNWIISEVSWFQSIIYYTVSCILSALFTASKKTSNSRIILFITLSLNVILERMLVQYYNNVPELVSNDKINLVYNIWLIRKTALCFCAISILYNYCTYKDEQVENFKILQKIEGQLESLQNISLMNEAVTPMRYSKRLALKRLKNSHESLEINETLS